MTGYFKQVGCLFFTALIFAATLQAQNQPFYFGNDLSYVNQMEDCGADYKYQGESKDPYEIFAEQGTNLVRVRLGVNPSWWQAPLEQPEGVKPAYSDIEDVKETIQRARENNMEVLLDFHYSDFWADPARQQIPRQWLEVAEDTDALADSIYNYTAEVLTILDEEGLMPNIVQVGNENNSGILYHIPEEDGFETAGSVSSQNNWSRHAQLFNAGIKAVRDVGETASVNPKISLHKAGLSGLEWWYDNIINTGVTDFDIIGFSYYFAWHGESISLLESAVSSISESFPGYEVMALETGYLWSEDYGGIINEPDPEYLPVIPEKQLEYMTDYTRAVMRAGGSGVIFWEPAWVDTPCRTPWITGSSHTHVAFFSPGDYNFMDNGGGRWTNPEFYEDPSWPKVTFKVDMSAQEISEDGVYITGSFTGEDDWELIFMADEGNGIFSYFTYLPENETGAFYFVNGNDWQLRETVPEACVDWWDTDRGYNIPGKDVLIDYKWASCETIHAAREVTAIFKVDMNDSGVDFNNGVYITGDVTGWEIELMTEAGENIFSFQTEIAPGSEGAYYYLTTDSWDSYLNYRETVPEECADWYDSDRGYKIPDQDVEFAHKWASCDLIETSINSEDQGMLPENFFLDQNYPNPFNPTTNIAYSLPASEHVLLEVFDTTGRKIMTLVDSQQRPGNHSVTLNGENLTSGIYLYRLKAGSFEQTKGLTLIK
ncbi:MAG: glycosyl hydrolase 53 family protein [Balneolaceae bacterium]